MNIDQFARLFVSNFEIHVSKKYQFPISLQYYCWIIFDAMRYLKKWLIILNDPTGGGSLWSTNLYSPA